MLNYSISEAAQAVASSHKMTARDVWDIARFALCFMIVPVLMTGLYLIANPF